MKIKIKIMSEFNEIENKIIEYKSRAVMFEYAYRKTA